MIRPGPLRLTPRALVIASACAISAASVACAPPRAALPPAEDEVALRVPALVRVGQVPGRPGAILRVPLEEYVLATILTEVAPSSAPDLRALERLYEVQAIVARTYAAANTGRHRADGFDLCASNHCQLVDFRRPATSSWKVQGEQAVARTLGVILTHDGRPALTVFHADCGGHTSSAADVWGGTDRPYLRALVDSLPAGAAHRTWRFDVEANALRAALNRDARSSVGGRLLGVEIVSRDAGGRVLILRLRGSRTAVVSADDFRAIVARQFGAQSIRSAHFELHRRQAAYSFTGRGFGHGVGLCQTGAAIRAALGVPILSVLEFYYPGTRPAVARPTTTAP